MIYNKNNKDQFLKSGIDLARHPFDAFQINDEIHLVYNIGQDSEFVSIQKIQFILDNYDEFLWTPYVDLV